MKLVKLLITNFRSIGGTDLDAGVEIDFEDINVINLIGQNNAGKSSILYAYEYFVASNKEVTISDFHRNENNPIVIEAWIKAETDEDEDHPAMKTSMCKVTKIGKFRKVWTRENLNGKKLTYDTETQKWEPGGAGGFDTLLQNACPTPVWLRGLDSVEIVLENVQKLIKEKVLVRATGMERYKKIEEELEELRKDIINDEYSQKIQARLTDLMNETFPELNVSLFGNEKENLGKKLSNFISTDINFSSDDSFSVQMDNHGHGIRRQFLFNTIRGLNDVFNEINKAKKSRDENLIEELTLNKGGTSKSKMLLIEEPELFLHPQSVRMFANVLYDLAEQSEFQIISATHSPIMVDLSREHTTLIRTEIINGETKIHQVKSTIFEGDEKERIKMLNTFNPYVCEAFFVDKSVLVEGDTEAIIYREVLNKMVENKIIELKDVPLIVNCGSKMNIPSFQKVLRHFDIEYFVIHDLDDTFDKNGKKNPAWTINEKIYDEIEEFNKCGVVRARRFVMERNFESQHNYKYNKSLGKPLSAYKLAANWDIDDESISAIKAIRMCLNLINQDNFDQEWVNARKSEPVQNTPIIEVE